MFNPTDKLVEPVGVIPRRPDDQSCKCFPGDRRIIPRDDRDRLVAESTPHRFGERKQIRIERGGHVGRDESDHRLSLRPHVLC